MGMGNPSKVGTGAGMALALQHVSKVTQLLEETVNELKKARQFQEGRRHFELKIGGTVTNGVTLQLEAEAIPQGFEFIPERIMAQAQSGCKLQLFENTTAINNFLEVVTNIQEYSNSVFGLIVEGPSNLIAVISGATASGPVSITISGQLVPKTPLAPGEA